MIYQRGREDSPSGGSGMDNSVGDTYTGGGKARVQGSAGCEDNIDDTDYCTCAVPNSINRGRDMHELADYK